MERIPLTQADIKELSKKAPFTVLFVVITVLICLTSLVVVLKVSNSKLMEYLRSGDIFLIADILLIISLILYSLFKRNQSRTKYKGKYKLVYQTEILAITKVQKRMGGTRVRYYEVYDVSFAMGRKETVDELFYRKVINAKKVKLEISETDEKIISCTPINETQDKSNQAKPAYPENTVSISNKSFSFNGYDLPDNTSLGEAYNSFAVDFINGELIIKSRYDWHPHEKYMLTTKVFPLQDAWFPEVLRQMAVGYSTEETEAECKYIIKNEVKAKKVLDFFDALQLKHNTRKESVPVEKPTNENKPLQKPQEAQQVLQGFNWAVIEKLPDSMNSRGFEMACDKPFTDPAYDQEIGAMIIYVFDQKIAFDFFKNDHRDGFEKVLAFLKARKEEWNIEFEEEFDIHKKQAHLNCKDQKTKDILIKKLVSSAAAETNHKFTFYFSVNSYELPDGSSVSSEYSSSTANYFTADITMKNGVLAICSPFYREKYDVGPTESLTHPKQEKWFPLVFEQMHIEYKKQKRDDGNYYEIRGESNAVRLLDYMEKLQNKNKPA